MATTPLGWPGLQSGSDYLETYKIPGVNRKFTLRKGVPAFVMLCYIVWYNENVERLDDPTKAEPTDEAGWNYRPNKNNPKVLSEHSGGTAVDLNWNKHPNGVPTSRTFTKRQISLIHRKMAWWNRLGLVIRWGGDYRSTPDSMHTELFHNLTGLKRLAKALKYTTTGRAVRKANPSLAKYL